MPDKEQVISQTRQNKSSDNKAHKDSTRQQKQNQTVFASFLTFSKVSVLKNHNELYSLVSHIIEQHGHKDESVKRTADKNADNVTYEMVEKKLCLDVAHHIVDAFKHYHPTMEMRNPKDNEFYRITVSFNS